MAEVRYWYSSEKGRSFLGHIILWPAFQLATTLCGRQVPLSDAQILEEPDPLKSLCASCRRRLFRKRVSGTSKEEKELDKLRKWDPRHPYLDSEE